MRSSIATSLAIGGLIASWAIAFGPVAFQTGGNVLFLLLMLSLVFLLWGAIGFIVRNEGYFVSALGGQMAWSLCAMSLLGNSALVLWGAFFIHVVVITSGSRGMWLTIWLPSVNERTEIKLRGILRWNMLMAFGWLGTAAAFSIMFFTATPWLVIHGCPPARSIGG